MDRLVEVITNIPQQPQAQDDATNQLFLLVIAANRLGLYDAADVVKALLAEKGRK